MATRIGRGCIAMGSGILLAITAACGSDTSGGDRETRTTGSTESDAGPTSEGSETDDSSECSWVSTDDVTNAAGQQMTVQAAGEAACVFETPTGDGPSIWLYATKIAIDQDEYEKGTREVCEGAITDVDAGDSAWTCIVFGKPQGTFIENKYIVTIDPKDFASDDEAFAALAKLLPKVTTP